MTVRSFERITKADLKKLATLKRKHDPDNIFRHTKNVAA